MWVFLCLLIFVILALWLYACIRVGAKTDKAIEEYFNKKKAEK